MQFRHGWQWMRNIRYAIQSRFSTRLVITTLPGNWYDADEQLLHANFQILVNFVEVECAWMEVAFDRKEWSQLPWIQRAYLTCGGSFRSREHGISYLRWESELKDEEGNPPPQADHAKQLYDLYWWWTTARKYRVDPFNTMTVESNLDWWKGTNAEDFRDDPDYVEWMRQSIKATELEDTYYKEDTQKLKNLIDLRDVMWT